jgi:hypothetical protein
LEQEEQVVPLLQMVLAVLVETLEYLSQVVEHY